MVGEVQVSVRVESDSGDRADARFGCGLPIAGVAWKSDACDGDDDAGCGVDLADACCAAIADVEVVIGIVCDGRNGDEVRVECRASVAFVPLEGRARDVVDDSVLVDASDVSMSSVCDDDIAARVHGDVAWVAEVCLGGWASVAAIGTRAVACDCADDSGFGVDGADALAPRVRDVDMAVWGQR